MRGETRVEICPGHHDAEAIGADQPHAVFAGRGGRGVVQRPRTVTEPGRNDQRAGRTATPSLIDDAGDLTRRRGDDDQLGHEWQSVEAAHRGKAADLGMARIHQAERTLEFGLANVLENGASHGRLAGACPNQRH